ncbi:MAG: hypothetical protein MJ108_01015 [Saccharofermentans sp.]|nr:hypothetical protein [Saccharofermentans sp.]
MKTKKITAVVLASVMMLSLAGCSTTTNNKYAKALDAIGYEHVKSDKDIEDRMDEATEDGFYLSTSKKADIESFCDGFTYIDADDCKSLTAGMKMTEDGSELIVLSVTFKDADAAEDFMDEMKDEFGGMGEVYGGFSGVDYADDEDDDYFKLALKSDDYDMEMYIDITIDGKVVNMVMVMASGEDDREEIVGDMEDFYKEIDEDSPADLL